MTQWIDGGLNLQRQQLEEATHPLRVRVNAMRGHERRRRIGALFGASPRRQSWRHCAPHRNILAEGGGTVKCKSHRKNSSSLQSWLRAMAALTRSHQPRSRNYRTTRATSLGGPAVAGQSDERNVTLGNEGQRIGYHVRWLGLMRYFEWQTFERSC